MGDYYNLQEGDFFVRLPNETVWNLEDNGITLKNELKLRRWAYGKKK